MTANREKRQVIFDYAVLRYGYPVRITTPQHSYITCVRKVHRKGDKPDGVVTGFMAHGTDFDAFGMCKLTPWVTARSVS